MSSRILLCCDRSMIRGGLRALLAQQPGMEVVGDTSGPSVADTTRRLRPDVVIAVSPVLSIEDEHDLAELAQLSKVVLIAAAETTHRSLDAVRAGVRAVVSTESSAEELLRVLRMIIEGDTLVVPVAARRGLDHSMPTRRVSELASRLAVALTRREAEVMLLLARGRSNAEIAKTLSVSAATVRSHVHHLLRKLAVGTRAQAVAVAYESGLINVIRRSCPK